MIVYVVSVHSKLGRKVKAVFENRDDAIFCCALLERDEAELEEYDTEAIKITGTMQPLCEWTVFIRADETIVEVGKRYTFENGFGHDIDTDGSGLVRFTQDLDVTEDKAKEIALEHWRRLKN